MTLRITHATPLIDPKHSRLISSTYQKTGAVTRYQYVEAPRSRRSLRSWVGRACMISAAVGCAGLVVAWALAVRGM